MLVPKRIALLGRLAPFYVTAKADNGLPASKSASRWLWSFTLVEKDELPLGLLRSRLPSTLVSLPVLLLRHVEADTARLWLANDAERPLTPQGRRVAALLSTTLSPWGVQRILTSPSLRCRQTVAPWAADAGIAVESCPALAEGQGGQAVVLVRNLADTNVALCSHGDVIADVLMTLVNEDGVNLGHRRRGASEPGSVWVLDSKGGRFSNATQLPPPDTDPA